MKPPASFQSNFIKSLKAFLALSLLVGLREVMDQMFGLTFHENSLFGFGFFNGGRSFWRATQCLAGASSHHRIFGGRARGGAERYRPVNLRPSDGLKNSQSTCPGHDRLASGLRTDSRDAHEQLKANFDRKLLARVDHCHRDDGGSLSDPRPHSLYGALLGCDDRAALLSSLHHRHLQVTCCGRGCSFRDQIQGPLKRVLFGHGGPARHRRACPVCFGPGYG